jgi:hypothetical protein
MELPETMGESGLRQETELLWQQLEGAQARLKQEKQWRVNATKVAERHKMRIEKLSSENAKLKAEVATLNELTQQAYDFIVLNNPEALAT